MCNGLMTLGVNLFIRGKVDLFGVTEDIGLVVMDSIAGDNLSI